jgi:hypothetical protein
MTKTEQPGEAYISTGIRLPADVLNVLRLAAAHRAEADHTRVSVSAVISDLVIANREILERKP